MKFVHTNSYIVNFMFHFRQCRFIAYQQLTRWCWGWLGKSVRVVLPSFAVKAIRDAFPSEQYSGFEYPDVRIPS